MSVDPLATIRAATVQDLPAVHELVDLGFGWRPLTSDDHENDRPARADPNVLVIERGSALIGTVRLVHEQDTAGIYGVVIHPD